MNIFMLVPRLSGEAQFKDLGKIVPPVSRLGCSNLKLVHFKTLRPVLGGIVFLAQKLVRL